MRVLIIGDTGGVGSALAARARALGHEVTGLSRRRDGLDLTDADSVARVMGVQAGPFDVLIVATGALEIDGTGPEKSLRALTPEAAVAQFRLNALGPALVMQHAARLMPRDRRAVFAALSARVGSIGDNRAGGWYSYRAAKAALNQFLRAGAVELARTHPQAVVAALHPGTVDTPLTARYRGAHPAVTPAEAAQNLWRVIDALPAGQGALFRDWAGAEVPW